MPGTGLHAIIAIARYDAVVAIARFDVIVIGSCVDMVITQSRDDGVIADSAEDKVAQMATDHGVVAATRIDDRFARELLDVDAIGASPVWTINTSTWLSVSLLFMPTAVTILFSTE